MFIAAVFIRARKLNMFECPPTDEWIKKIMQIVGKWLELENIILSGVI